MGRYACRGRFHLESDAPRTKLKSPTATVVTIALVLPVVFLFSATDTLIPASAVESAIAERMERDVEYNAVLAVRTVVFDAQNEVRAPSDREVRHWLAYGGINFVARQFASWSPALRDARDQYEVFVRHRIDAAVRWYGEAVARGYRE